MSSSQPVELSAEQLYAHCDPAQFPFKTTADLPLLTEVIGQPRAVEAIRFGIGMRAQGYNMYALGPTGTGKSTTVREFLVREAARLPTPPDWCYVHNFREPAKPVALRLPAGMGAALRQDVRQLIDELKAAIPAAFEGEDFEARKQEVEQRLREQQEQAFNALRRRAEARGYAMLRTPQGIGFAPLVDGQIISPEQFQQLPQDRRERIESDLAALQGELEAAVREMRQAEKAAREEVRQVSRQVALLATEDRLHELREKYAQHEEVISYLEALQDDIVENVADFVPAEPGSAGGPALALPMLAPREPARKRYDVNLIVDNSMTQGAPIVVEDNPILQNLVGTIEHRAEMGALVTDFTLIKPGALHRANGGYLVVDAVELLRKPFSWDALKRALRAGEVAIEPVGREYSLVSTVSLEPQPIPLQVKVVLLGEPLLYYLLHEADPDFAELFKVQVDFAVDVADSPESRALFARFVGTVARREGMRPFAPDGVARVIEHSARLAEDQQRLSIRFRPIVDLLREADYWAGERASSVVTATDVQKAIDAQVYRADRLRERIQEEIVRGTIMIDVRGAKVGQVNGLSVSTLGSFSFGRPSRITARTRLGRGQLVDIEREVALGGPLHSKGVLILAGYLGAHYLPEEPLSLSASLVFEQSYSGVEGDSASSAELYALLSDLSGVPIRQNLAVTGSVNQKGEVQAIGGVNEKIEGFFDVCSLMQGGLSGDQGVVIPRSNVRHLMLRHDVVEAVRQARFHIYAVSTIDEGVEVLTGVPAGKRDAEGRFPEGTVNHKVEERLRFFAERARRHDERGKEGQE
ncbi:MAG: ATP-binding protein [Anaerolineae bacterium]|nr:ATP-binding protein [Anaerolineae bacterium]